MAQAVYAKGKDGGVARSLALALFGICGGCFLFLIGVIVYELASPTTPTIPDPGSAPAAPGGFREYQPVHIVPKTVSVRVLNADYRRFLNTLRHDAAAHGGFVKEKKPFGRYGLSVVVPSDYLVRIGPLLEEADPEKVHPNYQVWARSAGSEPGVSASSDLVQIDYWIGTESVLFSTPDRERWFVRVLYSMVATCLMGIWVLIMNVEKN